MSKEYFCEKVGGMSCVNEECHDDYEEELVESGRYSSKKRLSTRERKKKYRKHLQKLVDLNASDCLKKPMYGGALYVDKITDKHIKKPYYRRYWRGGHNNRFKYWLKVSNRKVRRYKGSVHSGGFYKKIFDHSWTVD